MTIALYFMWPLTIATASAILGCKSINLINLSESYQCTGLALRKIVIHRAEVKSSLSAQMNINEKRYFRLTALGATDVLFTIPISTYYLYNATQHFLGAWDWNIVHNTDYVVVTVSAAVWRANTTMLVNQELNRWIYILCAVLFFGFFGLTEEARRPYRFLVTPLYQVVQRFMGKAERGQAGTSFVGSLSAFRVAHVIPRSTLASVDSDAPQNDTNDERVPESAPAAFDSGAMEKV